jgi:hypothetical protein
MHCERSGSRLRHPDALVEDKPAPGLQQAKVSGSDRLVYLHDEVIVTNADIADARIVQGSNLSVANYKSALNFGAF